MNVDQSASQAQACTTFDYELSFLLDLFELLDSRIDHVNRAIDALSDPDGMGCYDDLEYASGMGFIACQRYMTSTYGPLGITKKHALGLGPVHSGGETYARIINASANYWKHHDEWKISSVVRRSRGGLEPMQLETIRVIETVTPWHDYTCVNLLCELTTPNEPRLKYLLPALERWRVSLDDTRGK